VDLLSSLRQDQRTVGRSRSLSKRTQTVHDGAFVNLFNKIIMIYFKPPNYNEGCQNI